MPSLLERCWYRPHFHILSLLLLPLSWLFLCGVGIRHCLYRCGIKTTYRFSVPVIVVGNISVGGTGKTPFVIWLAKLLRAQGWQPGIVSHGIGGHVHTRPRKVYAQDEVAVVGDEALLLVRHTGCPLVVCKDRVAAVRALLADSTSCDVVISDDGLQHYALGRDIEVAIVDGERRFGNGWLLPAGPLREPLSRLQRVDKVIVNGSADMLLQSYPWAAVQEGISAGMSPLPGTTIHAVAAIGNPGRFFAYLRKQGFTIIEHIFPDHYLYQAADLNFTDSLPIVMTEKDAVKCARFADARFWYVPVEAIVADEVRAYLLNLLSVRRA
ncbi:MAG: tetraacyldisaccharide 4'-kinase [Gammaproteobacteria bacterium RIFCSPHIGHO2_12_FULL_41_20]|nr:MAG: tetraacyldisaccharide 4'-kinase [Gammaproteobacteria bacterium RIFCSPHIGHO2_12_FULL_41_20]